MRGAITALPNTPSWRAQFKKKAQGQLHLYLTFNKTSGQEEAWELRAGRLGFNSRLV